MKRGLWSLLWTLSIALVPLDLVAEEDSSVVQQLTEATFQDFIAQGSAVVDFYSDHCAPCRSLAPVFEQIAQDLQGQWRFGRLKTNEETRAAKSAKVRIIPTVVVYRQGQEVARHQGSCDYEELYHFITDAP